MTSMSRAAFFGSALVMAGVIVLCHRLSPSIPEAANDKRQNLDSGTIFKISLHPIKFEDDQNHERDDRQETERLVRKAFNVEDDVQIWILSIVDDTFLNAQVGTLSFSKTPGSIDQTRSNQRTLSDSGSLQGMSVHLSPDFIGLTPLYSGSIELQSLDIIAVPGLGGHAIGSFKAEKEDHIWLRDDLPQDLPNSRIYTYGHLTKVPGSTSFQNLFDLGASFKNVLQNLVNHNKKEGHRKRIVLIGHSLGGLIIKEALCQLSRESIDDVLGLIRGILFFGTPNEGMDNSHLVRMARGQPNEDFIRSLENNSADLHRLGQQWHDISKTASPKFFENLEIFSYYETEKSPTYIEKNGEWKKEGPLVILVDRNSATHGRPFEEDNRHILPIARTHSNLIRFGTNDNIYSNHVKPTLKGLLEMSQQTGFLPLNKEQKACLDSLNFLGSDSRIDRIEKDCNDTCTWLFRDRKYKEWSLQKKGLLRLKGYRTSGKSTLMKGLFGRMESRPDLVMKHFFWRHGAELQRNACGFFRSLMCQFLPSSYRSLDMATSKYENMSDKSLWELQWMKDFLEEEIPLSCKRHKNLRFVILIDALDECLDGKDHVLNFLTNLLSAQEGPQICVSYARLPGHFPESLEIDVASKNGPDITSFVEKKLSILPVKTQVLRTDIVRRAKGMFTWARCACEKVMHLQSEGKPVSAIRQAIESLPEELDGIFLETIREIKPGDVNETLMLFRWICFAKWPLTVSELQDAIMMTPDMKETSIESMRKSVNFRDRDEMISAILHLSAGLAETIEMPLRLIREGGHRRTIVQLIHDSVHEFLLCSGFEEISKQGSSEICSNDETEDVISSSHFHLSRSCIRYLSMEERHVWTPWGMTSENISSFPLLGYAANSWIFHTKQVELAKKSQDDVLQLLRWPSSDIFNDWLKVRGGHQEIYGILSDYSMHDYSMHEITLLHVMAEHGIVSVLRAILNNNEIKGGQKSVDHRRHHSQGLDKSQKGLVNLEVEDSKKRTPLWYAAGANEVPAAKLLLELGANPNAEDSFSTTPLYQAASYAGEEMIKAFLELPVERVRVTEELLMAVAGKNKNGSRIMKVLLNTRLPEIKITYRVVKEAYRNRNGEEVMGVLIEDEKLATDAFEGVLEYILKKFGEETTKSFLRMRCPGMIISENILVAAAGNRKSGVAITNHLFASQPTITVTERMMVSAARNTLQGPEVMKIFLQKQSLKEITTRTLSLATHSWRKGEEVMGTLLRDKRTGEIPQGVMLRAARNPYVGGKMIKAFLMERRSEFLQQMEWDGIPQKIFKSAVDYWENGVEVMQLLLEKSESALDITELAILTRRSEKGADMMQFLLEELPFKVEITTTMIDSVIWSAELMKVLLQKRGVDVRPLLTKNMKERAEQSWGPRAAEEVFGETCLNEEKSEPPSEALS